MMIGWSLRAFVLCHLVCLCTCFSLRCSLEPPFSHTDDVDLTKRQHSSVLFRLKKDLSTLTELRPPVASADPSAPHTIISAGSSYTRLWTHETWKIHSSPPHKRYGRHLVRWPSSTTARIILPAVSLATSWALLVSIAAKKMSFWATAAQEVSFSVPAFSMLAAPLALLLTLRANASMARLLEARLLFGRLILHARSLASVLRIHAFDHAPHATVLATRHLALMGWILKGSLRNESDESQQETLKTMLGAGVDYTWLWSQPKRTIAVTNRIRQICSEAIRHVPDAAKSSTLQLVVEDHIFNMETSVGGCERLFTSPIPPTYSRHLSRVLSMWLLLMPLSLLSSGFSTVGVVTATACAAYVMIGIDEVGVEIENAFRLLPLQQLAGNLQRDVGFQFCSDMPEVDIK